MVCKHTLSSLCRARRIRYVEYFNTVDENSTRSNENVFNNIWKYEPNVEFIMSKMSVALSVSMVK